MLGATAISSELKSRWTRVMFLIDANVISEVRKDSRVDQGFSTFWGRPAPRPHARDAEHARLRANGRAPAESLSQHKAPAVRPGRVRSRLV